MALVWLEDGMGDVVFKGTEVWLEAGVGAVVLAGKEGPGAAVVRLEVGAGMVPLGGDVGPVAPLELTGAVNPGVGVGNDVLLAGRVPLTVGMAGLELLTDTGGREVVFVGKGAARLVELTTPVAEADVFVGSGRTRVVELRGRITLEEGSTGADALPEGVGEATVPFNVVLEVGNGAAVVGEPGTGPSRVVEFSGTVMVVATAVPLIVTVETMAVTDGEDVTLEVGKGARRVVEFTGMKMLVAAAEPLALTVDALAVMVALPGGGMIVDSGAELAGGDPSTVVTTGPEVVVLANGGTTRTTSEHSETVTRDVETHLKCER